MVTVSRPITFNPALFTVPNGLVPPFTPEEQAEIPLAERAAMFIPSLLSELIDATPELTMAALHHFHVLPSEDSKTPTLGSNE